MQLIIYAQDKLQITIGDSDTCPQLSGQGFPCFFFEFALQNKIKYIYDPVCPKIVPFSNINSLFMPHLTHKSSKKIENTSHLASSP